MRSRFFIMHAPFPTHIHAGYERDMAQRKWGFFLLVLLINLPQYQTHYARRQYYIGRGRVGEACLVSASSKKNPAENNP